jgi:uncharacterized repeat protein (TIGR03803 family)
MKTPFVLSAAFIIVCCCVTAIKAQQLWGLTQDGGAFNKGTIFKFDIGTATLSYPLEFPNEGPVGSYPNGSLVRHGNKVFGVTLQGGANSRGTLFEFDFSTNLLVKLYDFQNVGASGVKLLKATSGKIYVLADDQILEFNPADSPKTVLVRAELQFAELALSLIETPTGRLIGRAGAVMFEFNPVTFTVTALGQLPGNPGAAQGNIVELNGKIYGLSADAVINGGNFYGSLFIFDYSTLAAQILGITDNYSFFEYSAGIMAASDGKLYFGSLTKIPTQSPYYGNLYSYNSAVSPGLIKIKSEVAWPFQGSFTQTSDGTIYGISGMGWGSKIFSFVPATGTLQTARNIFAAQFPSNGSLIVMNDLQSITFGLPQTSYTVGDAPFTLDATSNSGLPITYTSSNTNVLTVSGNIVTIIGAGSATITASQSGDDTFAPAVPIVSGNITVLKKTNTINFAPITDKPCTLSSFSVFPSASSGLPVTLQSSDPSVASVGIGGVEGFVISILKAGSIEITASQLGNSTYEPALSVIRRFSVDRVTQDVTVPAIANKVYGDPPFNLNASATSGLPITYGLNSLAVGKVSINNGIATILASQQLVEITATQAGNECYYPDNDSKSFSIFKAQPIITVNVPNDDFCFDAQPIVTFSLTRNSAVTINYSTTQIQGNSIIFEPGIYNFRLTQLGDANYETAYSATYYLKSRALPTTTIFTSDPTFIWPGQKTRLERNANGANQYQWLMNGLNIPGATTYYYNATQAGTYSLRATQVYTGGPSCAITTNSIDVAVAAGSDITVYPNPANASFTVQLPFTFSTTTTVKVLTSTGSTKFTGYINGGQLSTSVNCSTWTAGTYTIQVTNSANTITRTIVIQH